MTTHKQISTDAITVSPPATFTDAVYILDRLNPRSFSQVFVLKIPRNS